jgi:hypothetical protein
MSPVSFFLRMLERIAITPEVDDTRYFPPYLSDLQGVNVPIEPTCSVSIPCVITSGLAGLAKWNSQPSHVEGWQISSPQTRSAVLC